MRGEKAPYCNGLDTALGTSPYTRGKAARKTAHSRLHRNIPAYSGKSLLSIISDTASKEHPRIHGEKELLVRDVSLLVGDIPVYTGK